LLCKYGRTEKTVRAVEKFQFQPQVAGMHSFCCWMRARFAAFPPTSWDDSRWKVVAIVRTLRGLCIVTRFLQLKNGNLAEFDRY
jgi:hypothetical protein